MRPYNARPRIVRQNASCDFIDTTGLFLAFFHFIMQNVRILFVHHEDTTVRSLIPLKIIIQEHDMAFSEATML